MSAELSGSGSDGGPAVRPVTRHALMRLQPVQWGVLDQPEHMHLAKFYCTHQTGLYQEEPLQTEKQDIFPLPELLIVFFSALLRILYCTQELPIDHV